VHAQCLVEFLHGDLLRSVLGELQQLPHLLPTIKIEKPGHYSPLQQIPHLLPHPQDLSHCPHIRGMRPPPASQVGQSEQATWWTELTRGGGDRWSARRAELGRGRRSSRRAAAMGAAHNEWRRQTAHDLRDWGRATAGVGSFPSHPGAGKMWMRDRVLLGTGLSVLYCWP
jgi:hypothetical protein